MSTQAITTQQKPEPGTAFKVKAQEYAANALTIMEIKTPEQFREVAEMFKAGAAFAKEVVAFLLPAKTKAHAAWKEVCNMETSITDEIERGRKHLDRKMIEYKQADQRRQIEEQKRIEAQRLQEQEAERQRLQAQEEEQRLAQAEKLVAAGQSEEALKLLDVEVVVEAPVVPAAPVVVQSAVPKVKGLVEKKPWKARLKGSKPYPAEVTLEEQQASLKLLAEAVGKGLVPVTAIEVNSSVLNAQAKALKNLMNWPGCEAFEDMGHSGRG